MFKNLARDFAHKAIAIVRGNRRTVYGEDDPLAVELLLSGVVFVQQTRSGSLPVVKRGKQLASGFFHDWFAAWICARSNGKAKASGILAKSMDWRMDSGNVRFPFVRTVSR